MGWFEVLRFRKGQWVEVKSAAEIYATLDANGTIDGLPFMPEMLAHCGRRYRIEASAHKTCDTVHKTGVRGVKNAVHLQGLHCDGAAHGGCQAACLFYFRTEWLKRVSGPHAGQAPLPAPATAPQLVQLEKWSLRPDVPADAPPVTHWRCQITDLPKFMTASTWRDPSLYAQDILSGNVSIFRALKVLGIATWNTFQRARGGVEYPRIYRKEWPTKTPLGEPLNLQAGEVVRVKPKEAILETVDGQLKNRGLSFDPEMTPYCEKEFKVAMRVTQILDERSGRMLKMPRDCIMLEGVVCHGDLSRFRRMCPRKIPSYWRELWLERVGPAPTDSATPAS